MRRFAFVTALLCSVSTFAWADVAEQQEEIIVTASPLRVEQDLLFQGSSVIGRDAVVETLGQGLGETLDRMPGVASTYFTPGASRPIIRGLGEDRVRVLSGGLGQIDVSSISPDHAIPSEALEAERIEVLRGPAALAFGGNAVGGVVNVVDKRIAEARPNDAFSGELYGGIADGLDSGELAAGVTLATGSIVWRLEGLSRDSGDFEIPGFALSPARRAAEIAEGADPAEFARGTQPNSFAEAQSGALGASWVGDRGFIGLAVKRIEQLYGIPGAEEEEGGEEEEAVFAGPRIDLEQTRYEVRAGLNNPMPGFSSARFAFADADYAHTEIEPSGEVGTRFDNDGFEARLELAHNPIGAFKGVIGASGFKTDFSALGEEAFITPTETTDYGLFIIERGEFGRWTIEGGARLERRELDNTTLRDRSFDTGSVSFGAGFRPNDQWHFSANVARTERAPTEPELYSDGAHLATASFEIGNPNLDKEVALSAEIGAHYHSDRLDLEANIFHVAFDDFIALLADGTVEDGLPVFRFSADDATFTGAEALAKLILADREGLKLSTDLSVEVVEAELDGGGNVPRIPPRSTTLGVEADLGRFGGRVEWINAAKQDDVAAFESETEGFDWINARLSFRPVAGDDRLIVFLDGRNLTDEEARVHTSFVKDLIPRPGRSVRLALASRF
jgi:iron complex outermembrane receptor protein